MYKAVAFYIAFLAVSLFAQQSLQRTVLIEDFSASTCPPCATFDKAIFDPYITNAANQSKFTCVSYRAYWPGTGDPYNTPEANTRITYYAVNTYGVPDVFIANTSPNTGGTLATFTTKINTEYAIPAKATIVSTYTITGTTVATSKIKVTTTITPTQTMTGVSLFIALNEKLTTKNVATNGETQFHHVMMKMVPNASGRPLTFAANTPITVTDSALLSGTHIEEMTDLEVAVWAQNVSTKEILQSAWATVQATEIAAAPQTAAPVQTMSLHYSPTQKSLMISNAADATVTVHDLSGRLVARSMGKGNTAVVPTTGLRGCCIVWMVKNNRRFSQVITIPE